MPTQHSTIFIIDDDNEIRSALSWFLESADYSVQTFSSAKNFFKENIVFEKGCIITDVFMPEMDGIEFLKHIKLKKIDLPVIVLTGYGDIPMAVQAMKEGASDFIAKPFNQFLFLNQIKKVVECHALSLSNKNKKNEDGMQNLSARQRQILNLMTDGKSNKTIAKELLISISTVEYHRAKLLKYYQVKNLVQLMRVLG